MRLNTTVSTTYYPASYALKFFICRIFQNRRKRTEWTIYQPIQTSLYQYNLICDVPVEFGRRFAIDRNVHTPFCQGNVGSLTLETLLYIRETSIHARSNLK